MRNSTKKMVLNVVLAGCVGWTTGRVINRAAMTEENPILGGLLIATGLVTIPVVARMASPVIPEMVERVIPEEE